MSSTPSQEVLKVLFDQAASAPLQNLAHAVAVDRAITEVNAYFEQLRAATTAAASAVEPEVK